MSKRLLEKMAVLDSETTALWQGAGPTQVSVLDPETQEILEIHFKPNLTESVGAPSQDFVQMRTGSSQRFHFREFATWEDQRAAEVANFLGIRNKEKALKETWVHQFLLDGIASGKYPVMINKSYHPKRYDDLLAAGYKVTTRKNVSVPDIFTENSEFYKRVKGKTIWIANSPFESKQFGAVASATGHDDFRKIFETFSDRQGAIFDVTGEAVQNARALAQVTDDFKPMYLAMLNNPPPPDATAVRDVLDLVRSVYAYGRDLKLHKMRNSYSGTSIDMVQKLLKAADEERAGKSPVEAFKILEAHESLEDTIDEAYVARRFAWYAEIVDEVDKNTPRGRRYRILAERGEGPLYEVAKLLKRVEMADVVMQQKHATQRVVRAAMDLSRDGVSQQTTGFNPVYWTEQEKYGGGKARVARTSTDLKPLYSVKEVIEHMQNTGQYNDVDLQALGQEVESILYAPQAQKNLQIFQDKRTGKVVQDWFLANTQDLANVRPTAFIRRPIFDMNIPRLPKSGLAGLAALSAAAFYGGYIFGTRSHKPTESLISPTYHEWLAAQEEFSGMTPQEAPSRSGLIPGGIKDQYRSQNTDFASPYRGPVTSNLVLADQELLREREAWNRAQYGAAHYDPEFGLFGRLGVFKDLFKLGRQGYSFLPSGSPLSAQNNMHLNKQGLMGLELDGYKIKAEDADTIVIKRGGIRGAIASAFGMNRGYSFRLAGVDSPETSHGSTSYHAPQPHAEASKEALKAMINGSINKQLIFDPTQSSYGRMMGMLIVDGQNANFELVKRGFAAHLPYGKYEESMIDYSLMGNLEKQAMAAERGMWAEPYHQVFGAFSMASQHGLTFNTLTNAGKIAQSSSLIDAVSLMEHAQATGLATSQFLMAATEAGQAYKGQPNEKSLYFSATRTSPVNSYMLAQKRDLSEFMATQGTGRQPWKLSHRDGYGSLNGSMALDSMQSTTSVWSKRKLNAQEVYGTQGLAAKERKERQAQAQRAINSIIFDSPINHMRM